MWSGEEKLNYIYAFMRFNNKDMTLDFWQEEFIKDASRFISLLKSRQTGFSFIVAAKGLVKAMDPSRTKYTKQFVSYNEDDAQEKIRYAREFYESIPAHNKKRLLHSTQTYLEFADIGGKTTSRLISLPCRPPRGKNGDVCLDEFAIYSPSQSRDIYTAATFCTLRQGCIEVGSSPLGTVGKFYQICTDKAAFPSYHRYSIPWWWASVMCNDVRAAITEAPEMKTPDRVERFGSKKLKELYANSLLEDFQQECECTFVDESASYISLELIYANTPGRREEDVPVATDDEDYFAARRNIEVKAFTDTDDAIAGYKPKLHGSPLYMGYDVARTRDAAALYIIGVLGGKKRSYMRVEMRGRAFEEQLDAVRSLMSILPIYRLSMDATGMGAPLCERLKSEFGGRVEGVTFTLQSKEKLAMGAKMALERREYLLENDRDFHAQLHSIKRTASVGGSFRYDAERNESGHADSFWAWALASFACEKMAKGDNFYSQYANNKPRYSPRGKSAEAVLNKMLRPYNK